MIIYNASIHTMTDAGIIENGYVRIEQGKITEVGSGTPEHCTPEDIDAKGSALFPGFIDAHTHLGIIENGIDFEGDDCNEATDPFTPHLRVLTVSTPQTAASRKPEQPASQQLWFLPAVPTPAAAQWPF